MKCSKCGSEMEEGYVFDTNSFPSNGWQVWQKTGTKDKTEVKSYACMGCGYIEEYLKKEK